MCVCDIDVAILFLTLASIITRACEGTLEDLITTLSSCWMHIFKLLSLCLLNRLKEKKSKKVSITLLLCKNSE